MSLHIFALDLAIRECLKTYPFSHPTVFVMVESKVSAARCGGQSRREEEARASVSDSDRAQPRAVGLLLIFVHPCSVLSNLQDLQRGHACFSLRCNQSNWLYQEQTLSFDMAQQMPAATTTVSEQEHVYQSSTQSRPKRRQDIRATLMAELKNAMWVRRCSYTGSRMLTRFGFHARRRRIP